MAITSKQDVVATLHIGPLTLGPWDKFGGGDITTSTKSYRRGNGVNEVSAGAPDYGDIKLEQAYDVVAHWQQKKQVEAAQLAHTDVQVIVQTLKGGVPVSGAVETYVGKIQKNETPEGDSNGEDETMWVVTIGVARKN